MRSFCTVKPVYLAFLQVDANKDNKIDIDELALMFTGRAKGSMPRFVNVFVLRPESLHWILRRQFCLCLFCNVASSSCPSSEAPGSRAL